MKEWVWSTVELIVTGNTAVLVTTLSHCHPVHHKSHTHWSKIEPWRSNEYFNKMVIQFFIIHLLAHQLQGRKRKINKEGNAF
jgi:hypothetical protein